MRWKLGAVAAATMAGALTSVLPAALPAAASVTAAPAGTFGMTPMPGADGKVPPYFTLAAKPGQVVTGVAFVSNPGSATDTLKLSPSTGTTNTNTGTGFNHSFGACAGTGCWLTGLPGKITLPAETGEKVQFAVNVPKGTAPGQYLAGLTAEPAAKPAPVKLKTNGKASGRAIIVPQVTVGVAVTVGTASDLTTKLAIPGVAAVLVGTMVRLDITMANTGQTFTHATGTASCTAGGKAHTFPAGADTMLPGDRAVVAVNATGIPDTVGTMPCTVRMTYADPQVVTWSGNVAVPSPAGSRTVHTGAGAYSTIPASGGIPWWAIMLMVIGVAVIAALAMVTYRMRTRPRT